MEAPVADIHQNIPYGGLATQCIVKIDPEGTKVRLHIMGQVVQVIIIDPVPLGRPVTAGIDSRRVGGLLAYVVNHIIRNLVVVAAV